ncbi:MAG TPA: ATP-binding protein [Sandaracinaceae bacterium LLY-WYZ-13_1]|nr:ATP-binding protein [Sandaracinaceae bacterium LLY-WYZ-13_1]
MDRLDRPRHRERIESLLESFPVVGLIGPRQVGKTTLARLIEAEQGAATHHFDLEDPADRARLGEPGLTLRPLTGLVVIDEVQLMPELFPLLRVLADREGQPARFLLLGSASPDVVKESSESLAGRIAYHRLTGFDLAEVDGSWDRLWLRGGFPRAFLAQSDAQSAEWRRQFVSTFLQRDLPQLGITIPSERLRRFWTMLAHYHGQVWNASELARSFGVSDHTVRNYLDLLTDTFVVRQLQPWHANLRKRQVKSPKVFLEDSGLLHTLLGLETKAEVQSHPKLGASWEGFAMQQVIGAIGARTDECHFWATHAGAELDLLVVRGNRRRGFEFKRTEAPKTSKSMHIALDDLELDSIDVVHAGPHTFPLSERIRAVAISDLTRALDPLG